MKAHGVIKFQAPFERMREYDFASEVRLHKAIILQAIIDASNNSRLSRARKIELEAKHWLFGNSSDFYNTCYYADTSPAHVIRTAQKVIRLNNNYYNESLGDLI